MKTNYKFTCILALLALMFSAIGVTSAYATTVTVTDCGDSGAAGQLRTLMNDAVSGSTINIPACTITITGASGDDANVSGDLDFTKNLNLVGAGVGSTIIDGGALDRVFQVTGTFTVNISGVTVRNGNVSDHGGGIRNDAGTLTITNSVLSGNNSGPPFNGGGIYNTGTLTITNSAFSSNSSSSYGGGIDNGGTLTIANSTFSGNNAGGFGGGIYNQGTLNMMNTILANSSGSEDCYNNSSNVIATNTNNLIETNGISGSNMCGTPTVTSDPMLGALANNGGPTQTFALLPGSPAVDAGDKATCNASPVSNLDQRGFSRDGTSCDIGSYERSFRYVDTAIGSDTTNNCTNSLSPCQTINYAIGQAVEGDAINVAAGTYTETYSSAISIRLLKSLEIIGAGMNLTILNGGGTRQVVYIPLVAPAIISSIKDLTIQNGLNSGGDGGGIRAFGPLTLTRVKITGNSGKLGGGIASNYALTMTDSIVSANTATTNAGGGIYIDTPATVNLTNVTISGNTATLTSSGGVHIQGSPTVNFTNVTISGNTAPNAGGITISSGTINILNSAIANNHVTSGTVGGIVFYNNTLNIKNTIVAGNDGDECNGSVTSQGYNLSSDDTCSFTNTGDQQNTDPLLGVLADNGGYTQTHALLSGSPAINAGTDTGCPSKDQRGIKRPQGAHCDIGSYEANQIVAFKSIGSQDGWILETGEKTSKGGTVNSTSTVIRLGDDKTKKQYRGILSFSTKSLPDTAVIVKVTLKVRKQGITGGGNPVTTFKGFMADIKKGYIGTSASLQAADFQTAASKTYGPFKTALSGSWYNIDLTSGHDYINKLSTSSGLTQIRLRFYLDDNNNTTANYLSLYSGNAGASYRPQLVIEYYVP